MFKIAIVGAGGMGGNHANCYANLPNAKVVGIVDTRLDAAESVANKHGALAFTDFDAMVADCQPDIIDVCVPTPFHLDIVSRAAAVKPRGIVCEKPMARTVEDCQKMIEVCAAADVPLFIAHVLRFFPEYATATKQVRAGAVGQVAAVRTRRGGPFPRAWENWYGKMDWSGGLTLDLIIHDFDWLRWTFGDVERVYAKGLGGSQAPDAEIGLDYALVTLRFKSGVICHVEGTWADPSGFKVGFEIAGDNGLLEYNFNTPTGSPFVSAVVSAPGAQTGVPVPESPTSVSPYQLELAHFLESLEQGVPASVTPQDGLEAVRISIAALESMRTGHPVTL